MRPATIPLHIFSSVAGTAAKPQFAANLSIGDQAACDVTANAAEPQQRGVHRRPGNDRRDGAPCVGDCNGNGTVAINELITRRQHRRSAARPSSTAWPFDPNDSGTVEINELIQGVNNSLSGCPAE